MAKKMRRIGRINKEGYVTPCSYRIKEHLGVVYSLGIYIRFENVTKCRATSCIGSEEAEASVCPQNRAYGSVHGSSRKTNPLRNAKPMRHIPVGSYFLPQQVDKPTVRIGSRYRKGIR